MELNELIMKSIQTVITEGENQETSVKFTDQKQQSIKDKNITAKEQSDLEGGLKDETDKKNVNPQGEGGEDAIAAIQKNPKLVSTILAGILGAGSRITPNKNVEFTPPEPATDEKGEENK